MGGCVHRCRALLVVIGETRPLIASKRYGQGGVTPSTAFIFAILFTGAPASPLLIRRVASLARGLLERKAPWKTVFNVGQYTLSLAAAWLVLGVLGLAGPPATITSCSTATALPAIVVAVDRLLRRQQRPGSFVGAALNRWSFWEVFLPRTSATRSSPSSPCWSFSRRSSRSS